MNNLGLTPKQLAMLTSLFAEQKNLEKAVVFGSRAKGNYKKYSDVDIALFGVSSSDAWLIKEELDELPLIYKFDVLSYRDTTNVFLQEHIDRVGIVIFERFVENVNLSAV